jgi:Abnormal spindle-like microcephaly-assoc'd, ASPM-SPD-2-Hydin
VVDLSGVGVPQATLSPVNANFGSVKVGKSSAPKTFTLVNNLNTALSISTIATSAEFSLVSHCGATLPAKSKCETNVIFTPSATGAQRGTLSVTDQATDSPQISNLTGNGTH